MNLLKYNRYIIEVIKYYVFISIIAFYFLGMSF